MLTGFRFAIETMKDQAMKNDNFKQTAITALTLLNDRRYDTGQDQAQFGAACAENQSG